MKHQTTNKAGKHSNAFLPIFFFENYLNLQIRRFHTWQAGHEGTHVAFLPKMINHTWQAMHRGTPNAKSAISLSGNIPNPLTISEKLAMLLRCYVNNNALSGNGRGKNTGIVEPASDLHNTDTLGTPLKYLSNRRRCFFVDNKVVLIIRVFAIPIGAQAPMNSPCCCLT